MAIQPTQPQGIGAVLDTTFQLFKTSLGAVWPLCLLLAAISTPPDIYLIMRNGPTADDGTAMLSALSDPIYYLVILVTLAGTLWVIGALYLKQHAIGADQELSNGSALQAAVGRIVPMFLMTILLGIALVVGAVLLIIPFFILMVSLMLATALLMFEDKGPVDSLIGSHKLVWGNWWRTAVILTIGGILVIVIYMAVALVIGLVMPFVGLGTDITTSTLLGTALASVVVNLLAMPFFSALLIALYWDLKLRKEGGDLAARVGALNAV